MGQCPMGDRLIGIANGAEAFADGVAANIVMVDVLHHLEFPLVFLREAARGLKAGLLGPKN